MERWSWDKGFILASWYPVKQASKLFLGSVFCSTGPFVCLYAGMMLKLKLQYFGHLMRRVDSLEKTLMLGGIGGRRRRGRQRMRWLDGEWTLGVGDGQGGLACCKSWGLEESDTTERLNWTELMLIPHCLNHYRFLVSSSMVGPISLTLAAVKNRFGQKDKIKAGRPTRALLE